MRIQLGLIFMSTLLLFACSKQQRTVNKLEGKWNIVDATLAGSGNADPDMIFEFERCKVNQNDYCEFGLYDFAFDEVRKGLYSINKDDSKAEIIWSNGWDYEYQEFRLDRLNWRTLILIDDNASNGQYSRIKLRSVK